MFSVDIKKIHKHFDTPCQCEIVKTSIIINILTLRVTFTIPILTRRVKMFIIISFGALPNDTECQNIYK